MSDPADNEVQPARPCAGADPGAVGENTQTEGGAQPHSIQRSWTAEDFWSGQRLFFVFALGCGLIGVMFKFAVIGLVFLAQHFKLVTFDKNLWTVLFFRIFCTAKPILNPDWWWYVLVMAGVLAHVLWKSLTGQTAPSTLRDDLWGLVELALGYGAGCMTFSWAMKTFFYSP